MQCMRKMKEKENGGLGNQRKDKQKMGRTKAKIKVEKERQRNRDKKSVAEIEKEIILCRETQLGMCKDLKRCEHRCSMSPSTSSTLPIAGALRNTPVNFNLISVTIEVNKHL